MSFPSGNTKRDSLQMRNRINILYLEKQSEVGNTKGIANLLVNFYFLKLLLLFYRSFLNKGIIKMGC